MLEPCAVKIASTVLRGLGVGNSPRLLDHIRKHPDREIVRQSKIRDDYEVTNIWKIHPAHHQKHPAVFPVELAEKVIRYYSFANDVVLDPFAGIGTVGEAAHKTGRRFVLFEINPEYVAVIKDSIGSWSGFEVTAINWIRCDPVDRYQMSLLGRYDREKHLKAAV